MDEMALDYSAAHSTVLNKECKVVRDHKDQANMVKFLSAYGTEDTFCN